jgi:uncharacterized protein
MKSVLADAYFYLALLNPRDIGHQRAREIEANFHGLIVTTHWILVEVADALSRPADRPKFEHLMAALKADPRVTIVPAGSDFFERGVQFYYSRHDKGWSLTDCLSFTAMEQRAMTEAFTADSHFEQAGFVALMRIR